MPQKDLITDMVQLYEVNKGRDVLPAVDADVQGYRNNEADNSNIHQFNGACKNEGRVTERDGRRLAEKEAEVDWNYGTL